MPASDFPDDLRDLDEDDLEQRRQRLQEEAAETRRELEAEQEAVLESLQEEHGGDLIETSCTLPGDNPATIECVLNGDLIDRMSHVDAMLEELLDGDPDPGSMSNIGEAMDEAASVMAGITAEPKYSKEVFYEIYRRYGPEALGKHVEAAFEAIEREQQRKTGAADGFREQ